VPGAGRQRFARRNRLCKKADFTRAFETGTRRIGRRVLLYVVQNGLPYSRMGCSVSRRFGQATVRNRVKRVFREAFRTGLEELPTGLDIVIIPRGRAREIALEAVRSEIAGLCRGGEGPG